MSSVSVLTISMVILTVAPPLVVLVGTILVRILLGLSNDDVGLGMVQAASRFGGDALTLSFEQDPLEYVDYRGSAGCNLTAAEADDTNEQHYHQAALIDSSVTHKMVSVEHMIDAYSSVCLVDIREQRNEAGFITAEPQRIYTKLRIKCNYTNVGKLYYDCDDEHCLRCNDVPTNSGASPYSDFLPTPPDGTSLVHVWFIKSRC